MASGDVGVFTIRITVLAFRTIGAVIFLLTSHRFAVVRRGAKPHKISLIRSNSRYIGGTFRWLPRLDRKEVVLTTARYQNGCVSMSTNGSGVPVWIFRWYETAMDGTRIRKKRQIGTLDQFKTEAAAEKAAMG